MRPPEPHIITASEAPLMALIVLVAVCLALLLGWALEVARNRELEENLEAEADRRRAAEDDADAITRELGEVRIQLERATRGEPVPFDQEA